MSFLTRLGEAMVRMDAWYSELTGTGSTSGRNAYAFRPDARLDDATLEALFHGDPFAAQICSAVPEEGLRKGYAVALGDADADARLAARLAALGANALLAEAWTWGRCYGGAMLWVGADDGQRPELPLDAARIKSVPFLTVLSKRELTPERWGTDPASPYLGLPEVYYIQRVGGAEVQTARVHASRLIRFDGVLTARHLRAANQGWAYSELQRVLTVLTQFNGAFAAVGTLLQDSSQGVFSLKGLMDLVTADRDDIVRKRMRLMEMTRGPGRPIMIDADTEKFERVEVGALSGVAQIADKFMLLLAGAARIPVTILMGQSPAGLNATGDSDIRWFYDRVASMQKNMLQSRIERLVRLLCLAQDGPTGGRLPPISVEFASLYQMTPGEEADLRSKQATTDVAYIDKGVLTAEEVAISRFPAAGWSAKTTIDLDVRRAAQDADATGAAAGDPSAPAALPAGPDPEHAAGIMDVIERVGSRAIDRTAGIGLLTTTYGMSPEQAEAAMGETGRTHFTTPEPGHAAELAAAKDAAAAAQRSQRATKQLLTRVLERNKAGELVVGRVITGKTPDGAEGDVLEEGDAIAVPAADAPTLADEPRKQPVTDARAFGRAIVDAQREDARQRTLQAAFRIDAAEPRGVIVALPLGREVEWSIGVAAAGGAVAVPPTDLHVTLAYLGTADGTSPETLARIIEATRSWAAATPPIAGALAFQGRFVAENDQPDPVWLAPECETLATARERLIGALAAAGVPIDTQHPFVPHVTLGYVPKDESAPPPPRGIPMAITFGAAAVWAGPARETFALGGA